MPGPAAATVRRRVSVGLAGAGGAALATGVFFGLQSSQARERLSFPEENAQGFVTGLTQQQAYQLAAQARSQAQLANGLFAAGGALAAVGLTLWFSPWLDSL
jgi:hypothetical protein